MIESHHEDSALGTWTSASWTPSPGDELCAVVDRIWDFEGTMTRGAERTFPNGRHEIVVQLDEPHRPHPGAAPFPPLSVDGLRTRTSLVVGPSGFVRVVGVRLRPCGAAAILGTSPSELTDSTAALDDVIGRVAHELGDALAGARSGSARIAVAIGWVRDRIARASEADPLVLSVTRAIERDGGGAAIRELDTLAGRSASRFAARFRDAVGVSPKRFARIVRFQRSLERVGRTTERLGAIAVDLGYFDQAHFVAEFRAHAEMTPLAYRMADRYPGSDHLVELEALTGPNFQDDAVTLTLR